MREHKIRNALVIVTALICLMAIPATVHAEKSGETSGKARLVLLPLHVAKEDKNLLGAMETALVEGLQQKHEVISGKQVARKMREITRKESGNATPEECDETRCMLDVAKAFKAELVATANITKQEGGYFLTLSVQNIFDNTVAYSKTLACEGCSSFKLVDKLKELGGAPAVASAKPQTKVKSPAPDCVFPASSTAAPGWVCDMPVDGYELTFVGSASMLPNQPKNKLPPFQRALLEAVGQLAMTIKATLITSKQSSDSPKVSKYITSISIGKNISLQSMIKEYSEPASADGSQPEAQVNTVTRKLVMTLPCAYTMRTFNEVIRQGDRETAEGKSDEAGTQCDIKDVLGELVNNGINVVSTVKSPQGGLYLLLGVKDADTLKNNIALK